MKKFSTAVFFFLMCSTLFAAPPAIQKLSPRIRIVTLPLATSPTFISQSITTQRPPVVFLNTLDMQQVPRITAFQSGRNLGGEHQSVFAKGELQQQTKFDVIRYWQKIIDPSNGRLLGHAGLRIGKVELVQEATSNFPNHVFTVTQASAELAAEDLLLSPLQDDWSHTVLPTPSYAGKPINGRVVTLMREGLWAGAMDVLAINLGSEQGIQIGTTLSVLKQARIDGSSPTDIAAPTVMQNIATLFVFDVSKLASFAMVLQANEGISLGDGVVTVQANGQ